MVQVLSALIDTPLFIGHLKFFGVQESKLEFTFSYSPYFLLSL